MYDFGLTPANLSSSGARERLRNEDAGLEVFHD